MSALDRLVPVAVVGTARREIDEEVLRELAGPEALDLPPARALLHAATRAAVLDRVSVPEASGDLLPEPPVEHRPAPSRHYPGTLAQAIGGRRWAAVAESLQTLAARGLRLPVGLLHPVLEAAVDRRELRPLLPPVLGSRGLWLARANARWAFPELLMPDPAAEEVWQVGSRAERLAWFAAFRAADPARARELLVNDLAKEDAGMRAELLAQLDSHLADADEPLLEAALDDRGREARAVARRLLPRLPDSAFVRRMHARIGARITIASGRWQVDLAGLDDADARDGLVVDRKERPVGAAAVRALVAGAPLASWPEEFDSMPHMLVGIRDGLLELGPVPGLRDAAVRENDSLVAAAVLSDPRWPADPELVETLVVGSGAVPDHDSPMSATDIPGLDDTLARRVQQLSPPKAVPELAVFGFGPVTAGILLAWVADNRSAGQRGAVLQTLGDHGPLETTGFSDLATDLRRVAAGLTGADRSRALDAAMTLNLRRALAAEARPDVPERIPG